MARVEDYEAKIVAILHDVLEDGSEAIKAEARALLPPFLLEALNCVTKRSEEEGADNYLRFVARAGRNPISRRVKIADLEDNLDVRRLGTLSGKDLDRLNRYLAALSLLRYSGSAAHPSAASADAKREGKKILYLDLDNVLVDFPSAFPRIDPALLARYEHKDDIPGIFASMDPMPGAVESFAKLAKVYDTYILSTAPWENPSAWSDKLEWVKKHLGAPAYKRLVLSHHKELNKGDFLVDDRTKNGAERFEGELIEFGSQRFPSWSEVLDYLLSAADA